MFRYNSFKMAPGNKKNREVRVEQAHCDIQMRIGSVLKTFVFDTQCIHNQLYVLLRRTQNHVTDIIRVSFIL